MNKKIYKVVIPVLIIIELSFVFLSFRAYSNKDVKEIKEVSEIDRKRFSMYLEQEDGTYKKSLENTWPSIGYKLNEEKTKCIDTKGNIVQDVLFFSTGKLTVKSNKTLFCNVYLDIQVDIQVIVSTDDEEGTLPTTGGYRAELSCNNATATFNDKYQRIEVSNITSLNGSKCHLDYTETSTSGYTLLRNEVESKANTQENGYRYSGENPDNYIWFNNEMWRIIGSIPTCTSSGCSSSQNLVKIIRKEYLGEYEYTSSYQSNASWGRNELYSVLNNYYYGAKKYNDYGDFVYNGIKPTSYYGKMIKNVYWNTGSSGTGVSRSTAYVNETATQNVSGYIGLMALSDYGYASTYNSSSLSSSQSDFLVNNWIYNGHNYEWTCIKYLDDEDDNYAIYVGKIASTWGAWTSNIIRPVVYLDSSVYIISGTGTESDPYVIGM